MNPEQFKEARQRLGLSITELADILNTSPVTVRRWEMSSDKKTGRDPNPIACRVLEWLETGQLQLG